MRNFIEEGIRDAVCAFACAIGVGLGWQASKKVYAIAEDKAKGFIEDRKAAKYNDANNG